MNDLWISKTVNKEPYHKVLTEDKIINIAGGTGSGKTTFTEKYRFNENYIIIDTDQIKDERVANTLYAALLKEHLLKKYKTKQLDMVKDFTKIYLDILDYFKDYNQTIVIDSAQFSNIEDVSLLKGEIYVLRTSVDESYKRCIERFKKNMIYSEEELESYKKRKLGMYEWVNKLNEFLERLDEVENGVHK
ncbi:MAG: zeta toxin family protein [Bacilli bacterium]|nr:zeta toxin family protein [Bacilli bacterium]